jgi:hypothetical protein
MSNVPGSAGLPEITESFESIERLVMETPRGRWFLDEFARRQRARELTMVLDSIQRLEKVIAVKDAAAQTDNLASRISKAIESPVAAKPAEENLEARQLKYFKKDEEIFEPAPPPAPRAVKAEPAPEKAATPPERTGAKLTIRRKEDVVATAPEPVATQPEPERKEQGTAPAAVAQIEEAPKRRIVIIRHKAGEEMNVPLQNELAVAS